MRAVDAELQQRGLLLCQRPLHIGFLLHDAFGWEGLLFPPKGLADSPGFTGDVLKAKAHRWYEQIYGSKLNADWGPGYVPARIGNAIWRVRMPYTAGRVLFFPDRNLANEGMLIAKRDGEPATLNALCMVDDITPGLASRFTDRDLMTFTQFFGTARGSLQWAVCLRGDQLFDEARHDYATSVDALLSTRYAQSRWASAQAVEKTLKGLMNLAGLKYSRNARDGHDLVKLSQQLGTVGVSLDDRIVAIAKCPPAVRYAEIPSTESETASANHAALGVWEMLSRCKKTAELLAKAKPVAP